MELSDAEGTFKGRAYCTCLADDESEHDSDDSPLQDFWVSDKLNMNVYATAAGARFIQVPGGRMLSWTTLASCFERLGVPYAGANGAMAPIVIETMVFEYPWHGAYAWLQMSSLWTALDLHLYPGT